MREVFRRCLKASYEAGADGMALCREDLFVVSASRSFARFLNMQKKDISGKSILELVAFENAGAGHQQARMYRKLENGMQAKGISIVTPSGKRAIIDFWIRPVEKDLFFLYFTGSSRQKPLFSNVYDLENSVRKSQVEAIFRETSDHQLIYCNEAMIRMFGYDSFSHLHSFFRSDGFASADERVRLLSLFRAQGYLTDQRILCKRTDGSNFWGLFNCRTVEKDGEVFFDGVIIDISEQLKREELLRERADALEKINSELDRFIYSASHDIRAPISSMRGLVNLMSLDSDPAKYMGMLETSLNKLDNFVNELTLFSQNKRQRISSEEINFPDAINDVLARMQSHPHAIRMNVESDCHVETAFYSDLFRIGLVLEQVIRNSYEFLDPAKNSSFVQIQVNATADKAVIEVLDNGTGIPKAHVEKVFNMFYRASSLTKGAGIGLYIAREAVTLLKGTVSISSEFGVGTAVRIELPNALKGKLIARKQSLRSQRSR